MELSLMAKQANKTLIGAFVVGAVILAVTGILIFSSGKFFTEKNKYVLYFDGSVRGLDIGAPVTFKGVRIGSVTDIKLYVANEQFDLKIPIFIEIEPDRITDSPTFKKERRGQTLKEYRKEMKETGKIMKLLIDRGLRAQLNAQSMVTGKLLIQLDFYPDTPLKLVGLESNFQEIPTIPSSLDQIVKTIQELQELPIKEIVDKLKLTLDGIERLVNTPELKDTIVTLNDTLKEIKNLAHNVDGELGSLTAGIKETLDTSATALNKAGETLETLQGTVSDTAPVVGYELSEALKELTTAARSLKTLTDYLQQHPESLLRGKGGK
jgi:paraquat-inducible protein B